MALGAGPEADPSVASRSIKKCHFQVSPVWRRVAPVFVNRVAKEP